jgi:hypothetical protein
MINTSDKDGGEQQRWAVMVPATRLGMIAMQPESFKHFVFMMTSLWSCTVLIFPAQSSIAGRSFLGHRIVSH